MLQGNYSFESYIERLFQTIYSWEGGCRFRYFKRKSISWSSKLQALQKYNFLKINVSLEGCFYVKIYWDSVSKKKIFNFANFLQHTILLSEHSYLCQFFRIRTGVLKAGILQNWLPKCKFSCKFFVYKFNVSLKIKK